MQKELAVIVQRTTKQILEVYPSLALPEEVQVASLGSHSSLYKAESREAKLLQELFQVSSNSNV